MDIDSFIAKYGPEWSRLETATARGARGLTKLSGPEIEEIVSLYLRVSGHLAEVRTRYSDPGVEDYLNRVVAGAHASLYGAAPKTSRGMLAVFGSRYRQAVHRTLPYIAVAAALMLVTMAATTVWVATSAEARAGLLPPFAQEAVREAGARPDLGVSSLGLSAVILVNNVQVSLLAFGLGVTFGLGTIWIVAHNAVFIGALAGAFHAAGKGASFWQLVLPHGFLELTAICISAGAGLRMGWALVEPGERTRAAALAQEARDAVMVIVGVVPAFVLAAVIEGYVTGSGAGPVMEIGIGAVLALGYAALLFGPRRARAPVTAGRTP